MKRHIKQTPGQEAKAQEIGRRLAAALEGTGWGFTLFLFDMSLQPGKGPNQISYLSNADRASMIKAIKEWLAVLAADDLPPQGGTQ